MSNYFEGFIGQEGVKRKLGFYLDAFKQSQRLPFILLSAARGIGKTHIMREMADNLKSRDGSPRTYLELNCSTLQNSQAFFEGVFMNQINGREINIGWDEAHAIPKDLTQALLTICNTEKSAYKTFRYGDSELVWDFTKITMIFATTEPDKIFAPLRDRFESVDFAPYSDEEMGRILDLNMENVRVSSDALQDIVKALRGNARSCVKMGQAIDLYCQSKQNWDFGLKEWSELCRSINILPYGMNNTEYSVLKALVKRGPLSLQMLSSITGMSRSSLQKSVEEFLIKKDFIRIDLKRKVTEAGMKAFLEAEKVLNSFVKA
jgi:Holliday junction resolvasome RuvABC ATP-dependent DNA helicase subunit